MNLLFMVPTGAAVPSAQALSLADNANTTLVISRVELVVREMRFQRVDAAGECGNANNSSNSNNASRGDERGSSDDHGCAEFHSDAKVVELALDGNATAQISNTVPSGSYRRLVFRVKKLDDDQADDRALLQSRPELKKVSIRAQGTFQGSAFTYVTDLDVDQRVEFNPPLVVDGSKPVTTTLNVEVSTWFKDSAGNNVDPRTALKGGPNDKLVEQAIEKSFSGFGGDDDDGSGGRGRGGDDDDSGRGSDFDDPAGDDRGRGGRDRDD